MMGLTSTASSNSLDDELTNLTWLQDNNLLKNMTQDNENKSSADCSLKESKEDNENVSPKRVRSDSVKEIDSKNTISTGSALCSVPPVRYNPLLHTHTKPPYSFSSLIFMAIESSPTKTLPVKDIYGWIAKNFPYYQDAPDGWKNTVRHNLSLNKCFQKIEKGKKLKDATEEEKRLLNEQLASKGSLWCVDPNSRPHLLQSINKTPAHIYPYMSTAKTGTNLVQISNVIKSTNDNQLPNGNIDINNINSTVTIGNSNISPSNNSVNQSPKKIIALEKLPQNNILTTTKRVLIAKKVGREPEEADAAESMLTLTQCSTPGSLNNGNTYYIITNKSDNFLPIQLNKSMTVKTAGKQQSPVKNQITILTQPIIRTSATSQPTATITLQPTTTGQKDENKNVTITPIRTSQFSASTDHNYSSSSSSTTRTVNNVITIPSLPITTIGGQQLILTTANSTNTANLLPVNKSVNKIITIAPVNAAQTKNIIIKSPVKESDNKKPTTNKKQKVDVANDEDGLKCAEALFNLANGSGSVKLTKATNAEKKSADKSESTTKKQTTETVSVPATTPSTTLTRSAAKKLKTTA